MAISSSEQLWSDRNLAVTVEDADGACRTVRVATPYARIGSHDRAEVVLAGADISPCHLYLHATDEGIYCLGLAGSGPTGWLSSERPIQVGRYRICAAFDDDGPPPRASEHNPAAKDSIAAPLPRLRIRLTGDKKHAFELNLRRQLTVMGRHAPSTLCVHHSTVSRTHAVLFWDGRSLWAIDLLGANGIRRDGEPLDAGLLEASQRIALGDVRCRYLGAGSNASESGEARESSAGSLSAEPVVAHREAEIAEAASEIARLQHQLAAAARARDLAENTAVGLQRQLEELAAGHSALQAEAAAVRQELAASQEAIIVHQTAGEQRIADLREALNEQLNRMAAARDSADTAATKRERDLASVTEELRRVESDLATATAAREAAERLATERKRELDGATQCVSRLEAELSEARQLLAGNQREQTAALAAADVRIAALREQMAGDVAGAAAARDAAQQMAAERKRELDGATQCVSRLEAELSEARQLLAGSQREQTAALAAADARIAALREQLAGDVAGAAAAREAAEQLAAERERAVAEAAEKVARLEEALAASQRELASVRDEFSASQTKADERLAALRQSHQREIERVTATRAELALSREHNAEPQALTEEPRVAAPAASLPETMPVAAARDVAQPAAEFQVDEASPPTSDREWVLDDRVIGRLLDFRAKRETSRRRKVLWGVAACLAIVCLGAAAAAGRAWSARRQPADDPPASAEVEALIREALVDPDRR